MTPASEGPMVEETVDKKGIEADGRAEFGLWNRVAQECRIDAHQAGCTQPLNNAGEY